MRTTRFIYFDLGNVLLLFDHARACRRIASQTGVDETRIHSLIFDTGLQSRYEKGEISSEEFVDQFASEIGQTVDRSSFLENCSNVFELNVPIVPIIAHLRAAGIRLGILSNTCEAHWTYVSQGRYTILSELFDVEILSYQVGALKPSQAIYEAAIEAAGVEPGAIFFTDDRSENIDGAIAAGMDATQYHGAQPLMANLDRRRIVTNL